MPKGKGYFYDRNDNKYIVIQEHAIDCWSDPEKYGTHKVKKLSPYNINHREKIIIEALKHGFIRVRDWKGNLGWQFWDDEESALSVLKDYIKDNEIGDNYVVVFTDLKNNIKLINSSSYFLNNYKKS